MAKNDLSNGTSLSFQCRICKITFPRGELLEFHYRSAHRASTCIGDKGYKSAKKRLTDKTFLPRHSSKQLYGPLEQYPWICPDPILKKYFCRPCRLSFTPSSDKCIDDEDLIDKYRRSDFVMGFSDLIHAVLLEHTNSKGHIIAASNVGKYIKAEMYAKSNNVKNRRNNSLKRNLASSFSGHPAKKFYSASSDEDNPDIIIDDIIRESSLVSPNSRSDHPHSTLASNNHKSKRNNKRAKNDSNHTNNLQKNTNKNNTNSKKFALKGLYTPTESLPIKAEEMQDEELDRLFRNAHAIIKYNRPMTDLSWMLRLDELKGIPYTLGYQSETDCHKLVKGIAYTISESLKSKLDEAKFVSLLYDIYSDASDTEYEILLYVQCAIQGVVYTYFLTQMIIDKSSPDYIIETFKKMADILCTQLKNKIIAIAFDGASASHDFVENAIRKFHKTLPTPFLSLKCLFHRLEIRSREAIKCPLFESVTVLLDTLYTVYNKAPNEKDAFNSYRIPGLVPVKIRDSHWIKDTLDALSVLWKAYRTIMTDLYPLSEPERKNKDRVLVKLLLSNAVVGYAHLLQDILTCLNNFICELEKPELTFSKGCQEFTKLLNNLDDISIKPKFFLDKFFSHKTFQGRKLKGAFPYPDDSAIRVKEYLSKHFEELLDPILVSKVVDIAAYPASVSKAPEFGQEEIASIEEEWNEILLANDLDTTNLDDEWRTLKSIIHKDSMIETNKNNLWQRINCKYEKSQFPVILDIIDLLLSLPTGYNECSQGLRNIESIKKNYGGKYSISEESDILRVKLHTPDIDKFKTNIAIQMFKSMDRIENSESSDNEDIVLSMSEDSEDEVIYPLSENEDATVSENEDDSYRKLLDMT